MAAKINGAGGILLGVWLLALSGGCQTLSGNQEVSSSQVCFDDQCVSVEVAQTPPQRHMGLQMRSSLANDSGMLFIFPNSDLHRFWMKNTLIPLDMIWMDREGQIVDIKRGVLPCKESPCPTYAPMTPARYVLEVNAGIAEEFNLKPGETGEIILTGVMFPGPPQ